MFTEGDDWSKFPGATLAELYTRLRDEYGANALGLDPNSPLRARVALAVLAAAQLGSADFRTLEATARALIRSRLPMKVWLREPSLVFLPERAIHSNLQRHCPGDPTMDHGAPDRLVPVDRALDALEGLDAGIRKVDVHAVG